MTPDGPDRFLVTDGPREVAPPWPPTWFDHLAGLGVDLSSPDARAAARRRYRLADLDALMPQDNWEWWWMRHGPTPERAAFDYLAGLAIGRPWSPIPARRR